MGGRGDQRMVKDKSSFLLLQELALLLFVEAPLDTEVIVSENDSVLICTSTVVILQLHSAAMPQKVDQSAG